jgi:polynucleotide 5'-kinase involved in rRNA processing
VTSRGLHCLDPPHPFRYYLDMSEVHIPEAWPRVFEEIATSPGCVFMLGAPDTGKSTMAHFLCAQSVQKGLSTAYIDGDLGQSVCSPPTTLGMTLLTDPPRTMETLGWDSLYFIGSTSPANHLLATAAGVQRLALKAIEAGGQMVVVDTSGLVAGGLGFELKFYKIELLNPRHICAIQKSDEVEHILKPLQGRKGMKVHPLPPSQEVRVRLPEARKAYRQRRFEAYFSGSSLRRISLDAVRLICPGLPHLTVADKGEQLQGTILGLNDEEYFTRGLGIWAGFDLERNEVSITTPVADLGGVRYLHLGYITLNISP